MLVFSLEWQIIIRFIFQVSTLTAKVNEARMDRYVIRKSVQGNYCSVL